MANQYARQILHHKEPPPAIEARFFYTSPIPIDDPLSALPPPMTGATAATRQPPKPFSEYDNAALDKAWTELRRNILKYNEERGEKSSSNEGSRSRGDSPNIRDGKKPAHSKAVEQTSKSTRPAASSLSRLEGQSLDPQTPVDALDGPALGAEPSALPRTTGTPFIRAPSRQKLGTFSTSKGKNQLTRPKPQVHDTYQWDDASHLAEIIQEEDRAPKEDKGPTQKVAVGASRLHQVEMPELVMTPIYWAPVHDTAQVVRATWFYQDTMLPVETPVANMLESGYVDLQVWSDTWKDELNSAVEVGAIGEMKILHKLWPDKAADRSSRPSTSSIREDVLNKVMNNPINLEPDTPVEVRKKAAENACDLIDISTGPGGPDNKASGTSGWGRQGPLRMYGTCGVIYADAREAYILKPSLQPSSYYGRRPLANYIRKGYKLGVPVVRGFDQKLWEKLHPPKTGAKARKAEEGLSTSASGAPPNARRKTDPDLASSERPKVTDLVFVIHGIGQKLSERMESFHFTHAINAFRRELNVELASKDMKPRLRDEMGGIMVLPINWRHQLSFEEGGYRDGPEDENANHFSLTDITPETLPSVRNIVSDVMLDIPYYLSHHQPRMIRAVINEANRVYKLWCENNPGFSSHGRVHTIAHSLGSVMAIDILSRQPTTIPTELSDPTTLSSIKVSSLDHLLFQTHNLFLCGSPAGFFLLLKKAALLPRLDNPSITTDPTTNTPQVCGSRDQYGAIPVENVYNIMNPYDPVSYRLNAAVDASYSASLKQAWVPSSTASWTSWFTGTPNTATKTNTSGSSNAPPLPRLPSNVELETHNFTREEVAEKRMFALNDNGQIDYFLRYGGGPLEIQYLTMLGAHSSYWILRDFVRLVVQETGRPAGREGTVMGMRAVKRREALGG